ncbi:PHD finger protein 3 isoform X2 [Hemicordylus capensis]|uniref:PHD finger protein 3 isoform X2 n=1 Tax=Hemicordylus capensis TaxID=884348 RepID=UPI0023023CBA|nr:PHD finger protein 3 isoform X2 [Hemicordylus capensis]
MDIVDTFNHLIPTEHLDDALFLGSNLENEVCEDFSTSQNVLEDSLKNMLSDKDPMLGSASAQFCLPVLDSTDPNFQMPCSTVVGLDDIMDEGVKETARSTIDEDDISPNRNLRDQMDGASVKSPRKSPRLMTQEPVRSLRQSTLAKRSNTSPSANPKKLTVKSGSTQKGGLKQQNKGQTRHEDAEHPKEAAHGAGEPCQGEEATVVSLPSSSNSEWVTCAKSDELKADSEHKISSQAKIVEASHELGNSSHLPGTSFPTKEMESGTEVVKESKCGNIGPGLAASAYAETNQVQNSSLVKNEADGTMLNKYTSENSSEEKVDFKTSEELNEAMMNDKSKETEKADTPFVTTPYENASEIQETLSVQSSVVDGKPDCSLQADGEVAHEVSLPEEDKQEPLGDPKRAETKDDPTLDRMEFAQTDTKSINTPSAKLETNILEGDIVQTVQQQTDSVKLGEHGSQELQEDEHTSISSKCVKNVKPKHIKYKQNKISVQQKLASINQDVHTKSQVLPGIHSLSSVSLKRHVEEQGSLQQFHKPVKVKKKHVDKDVKTQSCDSGVALKRQPHLLERSIPRVQIPAQVRKSSAERGSDKSPGRHAGSKETSHLVSGSVHPKQGQLPHYSPKQLQKHHLVRANNCVKEEGVKKDSTGVPVEHLKEDEKEKLKLKKLEKSLQPRQRRNSRSLSVDEPPLFIPDNISTVKRESSEHLSPSESKCPWVPSKQCGFCRKPHGNRFMVGCGRCDDWFHGDCVGLSLSQAQQMGEDDKEYVCVKCCAEEDKKPDLLDQNMLDAQVKLEATREGRTMECEKPGISKQAITCPQNKAKQEDAVKHRVKIFKRESSEGKAVSECKDSEMKKGQQTPNRKTGQMVTVPRRSSEDKHEKMNKDNLNVSCASESTPKSGVQDKQEVKKKRPEKGGTVSNVHPSTAPASKPSADQIRQSVRQSLKEILEKRLADSTLKIPDERAAKVANKIEKELFSFFRDTDSKYKNKYRSLIFNLKDQKNNILFKRVLKGEVTPDHLIRMSPEELASKELAAWRKRENRHTIEMIEKEQREVERRPITKITHKGEIEIESETPVKEQEAALEIQEPSPVKIVEKVEEIEKETETDESATPDTTSQHRNHLFDLNCKICTGRMAPPSDDLSGKKVKVSVGVARKPSDNEAESIADALSSTTNILASELLEEDNEMPNLALASASTSRSETPGTIESETLFLARLNFIWKGFINMPSVAKFVIKAYPISGSFESLTEDLPDSIQVGGRISPQTVWEYVEKIKASGTKEICVVRFTPVTEEDQISYTLLFAYFSSRKRYGVAANNMKQIKDLYIIPLGASDKIPHQLVPFDGPGIEVHRPNLLLGLIIRQKLKRMISAVANISTSHAEESPESGSVSLPPEKKSKLSKLEVLPSEVVEKEEENDFFNSFTAVLHKQRLKSQQSNPEEVIASEPVVESIKHEPLKPLRFLPGVLVGWESQPSALELASKPLPVDDILQSLLDTTGQMPEHIQPSVDQSASERLPFLDKEASIKEEKMDIPVVSAEAEETKGKPDDSRESTDIVEADTSLADVSCSSGNLTGLSLKGKPPDVSTEAFLANLTILSQKKETKETTEDSLKVADLDNISQESKRTTDCPVSLGTGKGVGSNNTGIASVDSVILNSSKSPPFINLKRDPRQAAGRGQLNNASENEGDSIRNEEIQMDTLETEQIKVENKQPSGNDQDLDQSDSQACQKILASADSVCSSQLEDTNQLCEEALMQSIETVHSVRRGILPPAPSSQFETENSCHSEFSTKISSPVAGGNFSPIRTQQPNFQHTKATPPGFQFQGAVAPNFPPQNNPVFGFPPHLPPPLLPPPGFGFAQNPLMPWPPVIHLSGQPPHFVGPVAPAPPLVHKQSRFSGPDHFYQSRDNRRPERRHSDPWGRQGQHMERAFSRRKSDQHRQRFYSDSHHQKKGRHDWEPDSERNRHRDRNQEKERDRKSRDEGHRDKERSRLSHSDKDSEGKSSRESRNPEKKDVPKSEERAHEKEKEREKSRERHRERDSEKNRDRHHKDRDHSDRSKRFILLLKNLHTRGKNGAWSSVDGTRIHHQEV